MKKILLTGFKPYGEFRINITERILKNFKEKKNLKKTIFPVVFLKEFIIGEIKKWKPDVILSFGQCSRGKLLRIERKTKNQIKIKRGKGRRINKRGPREYFVNLKLEEIKGSRISYDVGEYGCNFLMYTIMDYIKKNNLSTKFAFIHIPKDLSIKEGTRFIEKIFKLLKLK